MRHTSKKSDTRPKHDILMPSVFLVCRILDFEFKITRLLVFELFPWSILFSKRIYSVKDELLYFTCCYIRGGNVTTWTSMVPCRVPTENPCHRLPRLGAFIFCIPVTCREFVNRRCRTLVSCFGLAGGCGRATGSRHFVQRGRVKVTRTTVRSRHPCPGRKGARRV